jgi:hypothetical protein
MAVVKERDLLQLRMFLLEVDFVGAHQLKIGKWIV